MMTTCLHCRVVRLRIISKSFLAFGRTPEQVLEMIAAKNPDLQVWLYDDKPEHYRSLNVSKDGWHHQLLRIPA